MHGLTDLDQQTRSGHLRLIALFFLLTFLDEKTALAAAESAGAQYKALPMPRGNLVDEMARRTDLLQILNKTFLSHRKSLPRNRPTILPTSSWRLPEGLDLKTWSKFQKAASDAEIIAVVLSRILNFNDAEIAEGLGLTIGTTRYRISKGIRGLGGSFPNV